MLLIVYNPIMLNDHKINVEVPNILQSKGKFTKLNYYFDGIQSKLKFNWHSSF